MTQLACRAYKIADTYRERGVKVIMGGIHASAVPEEVLEHADSVVIGEGEGVWPQVLLDAEKGDRSKKRCGLCSTWNVKRKGYRWRVIRLLPIGKRPVFA